MDKETEVTDKRFEITFIVNGQPIEVKVGLDEQIGEAVADALKDSGDAGQSPDRWELRDARGEPVDTGKKIGEAGITPGAKLFLNLKAGVGGSGV